MVGHESCVRSTRSSKKRASPNSLQILRTSKRVVSPEITSNSLNLDSPLQTQKPKPVANRSKTKKEKSQGQTVEAVVDSTVKCGYSSSEVKEKKKTLHMDVSPEQENNRAKRRTSARINTPKQNLMCSENVQNGPLETSDTAETKIEKLSKRKYKSKPITASTRVLRIRSQEKPKVPLEPSENLENATVSVRKERKRKKKMIKKVLDEYSIIRNRLSYFLQRIAYEKNLIDAYSSEGWKGLSVEKLKPEKELKRATSEILRRKLKIRELFHHLDSLCAEGQFQESLFDSEGQIFSDDIYCAKCKSKDVSADNDIILCDGACDRGFHQFCLEPPLSKEKIPSDEDGWLCPGCDCKVDCIDILNGSQGTDLSFTDNWEKVFPKAAAAAAGNEDGGFTLPSYDSEDMDYNPDGPEVDEKVKGDDDESSSNESDELVPASTNKQLDLVLPSDDSEDDDYDPNTPCLDNQAKQESSSSDFSSNLEELGVVIDDDGASDEDEDPISLPLESNLGQDDFTIASVSRRRNVARLDYKKLHDEEYGDNPVDSSDDEEWTGTVAPKKRKTASGKVASPSPNRIAQRIKNGTNTNSIEQEIEHTLDRRAAQKLNIEGASPDKSQKSSSKGPGGKSGRHGRSVNQGRTGTVAPKKRKTTSGNVASPSPNGITRTIKNGTNTKSIEQEIEHTPDRRAAQKLNIEGVSPDKSQKSSSKGPGGKGGRGRKSVYQVSKWFEPVRRSHRDSSSYKLQISPPLNAPKTHTPPQKPKGPKVDCNGAENKEPAIEEHTSQKSVTRKSGKKTGNLDKQVSDETPNKGTSTDPRNILDVQRSSGVQTRSRKNGGQKS